MRLEFKRIVKIKSTRRVEIGVGAFMHYLALICPLWLSWGEDKKKHNQAQLFYVVCPPRNPNSSVTADLAIVTTFDVSFRISTDARRRRRTLRCALETILGMCGCYLRIPFSFRYQLQSFRENVICTCWNNIKTRIRKYLRKIIKAALYGP